MSSFCRMRGTLADLGHSQRAQSPFWVNPILLITADGIGLSYCGVA